MIQGKMGLLILPLDSQGRRSPGMSGGSRQGTSETVRLEGNIDWTGCWPTGRGIISACTESITEYFTEKSESYLVLCTAISSSTYST